MTNPKAKNKAESFADLIADSHPVQREVECGDHIIVIQELSGRARFELAERAEADRWDTMLWVCMQAIVDPKPADVIALEMLKPEWIIKIGNEAMQLSGITEDEVDVAKAENGSAGVSDIGGS